MLLVLTCVFRPQLRNILLFTIGIYLLLLSIMSSMPTKLYHRLTWFLLVTVILSLVALLRSFVFTVCQSISFFITINFFIANNFFLLLLKLSTLSSGSSHCYFFLEVIKSLLFICIRVFEKLIIFFNGFFKEFWLFDVVFLFRTHVPS